jgi:hypothetical protein
VLGIVLPKQEPEKDFQVLPENWDAIDLFLRCQTQWNTSVGGVTGLNYASVLAIIDMYKYADPVSVFEDLQVLEITAMSLLNKESK